MQHSFDIEQQQRWSTNNCHHRKLLLTNSTKATLENTCAENKACMFSTADPRRGKHANVLLVPFIILLYYVCFHSRLSEETIPSALITILALCLLTIHRLSAISSLLAFRETKEFKNLGKHFLLVFNVPKQLNKNFRFY